LTLSQNYTRILILNRYRGILQEVLTQDLYLLKNSDLIYIEIFLHLRKNNKNYSEHHQSFRAWEASNYLIYLRITTIKQNKELFESFNEKINVQELLRFYIFKHYKPENHEYMLRKFEFKQGIFKDIGKMLLEEVKVSLKNSEFEILKNGNFLEKLVNNGKSLEISKIQIYRAVLCVKPLQIVTMNFDKIKEIFIFQVYNNEKSKMVESKITLRKAQNLIPYIRCFLTLGLFEKLGVRLLKELKIKLLMNAYLKIN